MHEPDTVLFHEYGAELRASADGALILNVLCGRVGQFGVEFPLNRLERLQYRLLGDSYLRRLAAKVYSNPPPYAARGRTC